MAEDEDLIDEHEETRDADEMVEKMSRMATNLACGGWPCGADGKPMAIVTGSASDKIPTVKFGNLVVGPVMIQRPVSFSCLQDIVDAARETQRAAEFVVGSERRLAQWSIDPSSRIRSPIDASEVFGSPPTAYDPVAAPPDPRAAVEQAEAVAKQQAEEQAKQTPPPGPGVSVG